MARTKKPSRKKKATKKKPARKKTTRRKSRKKKSTKRKKKNPISGGGYRSHRGRKIGKHWLSEAEEEAIRVLQEDPLVIDKMIADIEEARQKQADLRAKQKDLIKLLADEEDPAAQKLIRKGAAELKSQENAIGNSADRLRVNVTKYFQASMRAAADQLQAIRMMPGAAMHRDYIAQVERQLQMMKAGRPTLSERRDSLRMLRADLITLEDVVSKTVVRRKGRRAAARRAPVAAAPTGGPRGAAAFTSEQFHSRYTRWAKEQQAEVMSASKRLGARPSRGSFDALVKVWRSAAKKLIAIPGMKQVHAVFLQFEETGARAATAWQGVDAPSVGDIMNRTNLDHAAASTLRKLYMDARFVDVQLSVIARRIDRGETVTKTELRRVEERLATVFGTAKLREAALTPAMARADIKKIRQEIKDAKDFGMLSEASTQRILLADIKKLSRKYSGTKIAEWPKKQKTKILEDISGLRAMVEAAKKGVVARPKKRVTAPKKKRAKKPAKKAAVARAPKRVSPAKAKKRKALAAARASEEKKENPRARTPVAIVQVPIPKSKQIRKPQLQAMRRRTRGKPFESYDVGVVKVPTSVMYLVVADPKTKKPVTPMHRVEGPMPSKAAAQIGLMASRKYELVRKTPIKMTSEEFKAAMRSQNPAAHSLQPTLWARTLHPSIANQLIDRSKKLSDRALRAEIRRYEKVEQQIHDLGGRVPKSERLYKQIFVDEARARGIAMTKKNPSKAEANPYGHPQYVPDEVGPWKLERGSLRSHGQYASVVYKHKTKGVYLVIHHNTPGGIIFDLYRKLKMGEEGQPGQVGRILASKKWRVTTPKTLNEAIHAAAKWGEGQAKKPEKNPRIIPDVYRKIEREEGKRRRKGAPETQEMEALREWRRMSGTTASILRGERPEVEVADPKAEREARAEALAARGGKRRVIKRPKDNPKKKKAKKNLVRVTEDMRQEIYRRSGTGDRRTSTSHKKRGKSHSHNPGRPGGMIGEYGTGPLWSIWDITPGKRANEVDAVIWEGGRWRFEAVRIGDSNRWNTSLLDSSGNEVAKRIEKMADRLYPMPDRYHWTYSVIKEHGSKRRAKKNPEKYPGGPFGTSRRVGFAPSGAEAAIRLIVAAIDRGDESAVEDLKAWGISMKDARALADRRAYVVGSEYEGFSVRYHTPDRNPHSKRKTTKKKATKKKDTRRKTPPYQLLINRCQKLWSHYCQRPSKKRLEAIYVHLDKMKESTSKKVKAERSRCLRAANQEAKRLKYKRKK